MRTRPTMSKQREQGPKRKVTWSGWVGIRPRVPRWSGWSHRFLVVTTLDLEVFTSTAASGLELSAVELSARAAENGGVNHRAFRSFDIE